MRKVERGLTRGVSVYIFKIHSRLEINQMKNMLSLSIKTATAILLKHKTKLCNICNTLQKSLVGDFVNLSSTQGLAINTQLTAATAINKFLPLVPQNICIAMLEWSP